MRPMPLTQTWLVCRGSARVAAIALSSFVALTCRLALAQDGHPHCSLEWARHAGAEQCISRDALVRAVELRLRRNVFVDQEDADFAVRGHVDRAPEGWVAVVGVWDKSGKYIGARELHAPDADCGRLGEALGLVVALIAESPSEHVTLHLPPTPQPVRVQPTTRRPQIARDSPSAASAPALTLDSSIGVIVAAGLLPGFRTGFTIGSSVESDAWRAAWALGLWNPGRFSAPEGEVSTEAWQGEARVCPLRLERAWLRVEPCSGLVVGRIVGRGDGFPTNRVSTSWFSQLGLGVDATALLGDHAFVRLGARAGFALIRTRFSFIDPQAREQEFWKSSAVCAAGDLSVGVRFR